jgi:hypothetical protein
MPMVAKKSVFARTLRTDVLPLARGVTWTKH